MARKRTPEPLRLLPGGHCNRHPDPRCQVGAQAVMAGAQEFRVQASNAQVTGRGHGVISIRVGRVLIYLEDRDALESWERAFRRARELKDAAFGPELPEARYMAMA